MKVCELVTLLNKLPPYADIFIETEQEDLGQIVAQPVTETAESTEPIAYLLTTEDSVVEWYMERHPSEPVQMELPFDDKT